MPHYPREIEYSSKYNDDFYEYRHVLLPKDIYKKLDGRLLSEDEWRALGISQSKGWVHYTIHKPEPHVLLFRRPLYTDPITGTTIPEFLEKVKMFEEKRKKMYD
jgi:cyclin-dependent kinase regulatory subunit CKS1